MNKDIYARKTSRNSLLEEQKTKGQVMYGEYLKLNAFYMNPATGSVALGSEWENDFKEDRYVDDWEEWGGETLFEVENIDGEWVEVE